MERKTFFLGLALLTVLAGAGVEVVEYTPAPVKKAVTGSGRADKAQLPVGIVRVRDTRCIKADWGSRFNSKMVAKMKLIPREVFEIPSEGLEDFI